MNWADVREAFKAAREAKGLGQHQVRGVVQPMVSKMEGNDKLGPSVGTFIKAVEGIGMPLSLFFAQIEGLPTVQPEQDNLAPPPQPRTVRDEATLQASARYAEETIETLADLLAIAREGRDALHRRQAPSLDPAKTRNARHHKKRNSRNSPQRSKTRRPKD